MAMLDVDYSCLLRADSRHKSVGTEQPAFIKWTGWTLSVPRWIWPWGQHH